MHPRLVGQEASQGDPASNWGGLGLEPAHARQSLTSGSARVRCASKTNPHVPTRSISSGKRSRSLPRTTIIPIYP